MAACIIQVTTLPPAWPALAHPDAAPEAAPNHRFQAP
jgi:hypothetical protein